jgi:hypothetical protein
MPDGSLECLLGRMQQSIEDIRNDVKDIREEQKRLANYVDTQKIGVKILTALAMAVGGLFVYYKEHLETIFFGKVTNLH